MGRSGRWGFFALALVLALAGCAFVAQSVREHEDARDDLAAARRDVVTARANSSNEASELTTASDAVQSVREQLGAIDTGAGGVAELDQRDLDVVRAAITAGLAGNLNDYNSAVDQRSALDPQHDAALEQLRLQANAVIEALTAVN